jgi:histidinol dehydrogenase
MKTLRYTDASFAADLEPLLNRTAFDPEIEKAVAEILAGVRRDGDAALSAYARQFDGAALVPAHFRVAEAELVASGSKITSTLRQTIRRAVRQVKDFAQQRRPHNWVHHPRPGVTLGEQYVPLDRIGAYVPGGTAPLVSTVIHTVAIAAAAGVKEIVVITPPGKDGSINPAILYAARMAGATEVYRLGGVYGIAALAFGTASVKRVQKIVGPGNAYVTAAKRQVYGYCSLDMVAGPSEILVIADNTANPAFVAADILSQAEHGSGREQAVLVTDDPALPAKVQAELTRQAALLSRSATVARVLEHGVFLIVVKDLDMAAEVANRYAPEHLEILTAAPKALSHKITCAGAIFLGVWTPEPLGDFVAGPSHVLPTGGAARSFSGLTIEQFFRRMSLVQYNEKAFMDELPHLEQFAAAEGLDAHGRSATIRRDRN